MKERSDQSKSPRRLPALPLAAHKRRTSCNAASAWAASLGEPNHFAPIILPPTSSPERGQPCPPPYDFVPHDSVDSKWTGPFSTRFCPHRIYSTTLFPKAGYTNTLNSKWTKRIDFWSVLVHFEIGTHGRPPSSVLPSSNKNSGKEKVKFWMLHQPLTSMATGIGQQKVKKR